jgi:hypothetical protein
MFNQLAKLFREPEHGTVRFSFVALNENDKPYEDIATVPYHDEFDPKIVESKFRKFMLLRKHLVLEITVLEVVKTSG